MIPATEGVLRLQMKSKSSIPCTALVCIPLEVYQHFPTLNILITTVRLIAPLERASEGI
jgi:hypothetical protein